MWRDCLSLLHLSLLLALHSDRQTSKNGNNRLCFHSEPIHYTVAGNLSCFNHFCSFYICGSTCWIIRVRTLSWIYTYSRNISYKWMEMIFENAACHVWGACRDTAFIKKLISWAHIFGNNLDLRSAMSKFDWPTTAELISLLSSVWATQSHSSSSHPNN